jgi:flagellar export protein FliJ
MTSKRLARLVRLKELAEQARATELAERRRSLAHAESELAQTRQRIDAVEHAGGIVTADQLVAIADYQEHLSRQVVEQKTVVAARNEGVREAEVAVHAAWTDRRSMQSVHDRATDREDAEGRRQEQLAMAEIALNRSRRNS